MRSSLFMSQMSRRSGWTITFSLDVGYTGTTIWESIAVSPLAKRRSDPVDSGASCSNTALQLQEPVRFYACHEKKKGGGWGLDAGYRLQRLARLNINQYSDFCCCYLKGSRQLASNVKTSRYPNCCSAFTGKKKKKETSPRSSRRQLAD